MCPPIKMRVRPSKCVSAHQNACLPIMNRICQQRFVSVRHDSYSPMTIPSNPGRHVMSIHHHRARAAFREAAGRGRPMCLPMIMCLPLIMCVCPSYVRLSAGVGGLVMPQFPRSPASVAAGRACRGDCRSSLSTSESQRSWLKPCPRIHVSTHHRDTASGCRARRPS